MGRMDASSCLALCLLFCTAACLARVPSDSLHLPDIDGKAATGFADGSERARNGRRPNIVFLLTDDQDAVMGVRPV